MEDFKQHEGGGVVKGVLIFLFFLGIAIGYYVFIDWALMVHAQNLPFPYK
jgi:hypothetical protein